MEALWLSAPCPALRLQGVDAAGALRWQLNDCALDWAVPRGIGDADWAALAARQAAAADEGGERTRETLGAGRIPLRCRRVPMADGWLVWLTDETGHGVLSVSLAEQLELTQRLCRFGLWERDMRTGQGRWDATMFEMYGFDPAGPVPSFDEALAHVHPDDRERLAAYHYQVREGGGHQTSVQVRLLRADGGVRHLESISELWPGADGRPERMLGVQIDVTATVERMLAQQREVEHLARSIELADVGIWRVDLATERLRLNERASRLAGIPYRPDGVGRAEVRRNLHADDLGGIERAERDAIDSGEVVDFIARIHDDAGVYRSLLTRRVVQRDARGRPVELAGVLLDISTLEAERAQATGLRRRMLQLSDALGFGLWTRDVPSQRIEWDAQMFRLYGRPPEAGPPTVQEYFERYVHPLDVDALLATQNAADHDWAPEVHSEFRIRTPGGVRWIATWTRRELRDGRRTAFGAHADVTERHNAAEARRDKERIEQASRAQAEFVAHVSHELRTPLNAVLGFAQLIDDDRADPLSPSQRERLRPLLAAASHLRSLVDDTLDLTRLEADRHSIQIESVSLGALSAEAVEMARALADRQAVALRLPPPQRDGVDRVLADRRRLMQVLTNLLTNAVKYNRRDGWVQIDIERRRRDGLDELALVVRDSGCGMTAQQLTTLFEPFNRLGAEQRGIEGSGIGLTIVRRFTERMGGSVGVESRPGQGSEFRVWLPAAPPASGREVAGRSRVSVLCIEDNEINMLLLREMFAMRPEIDLHCEPDGASGIAAALRQRPALVLLDLHLPDMHGVQVLQRLRQEPGLRSTRIVALSANAMPTDVRSALAAGFDDYWTKPIDFMRFQAGLDEIVANVRTHRGEG